MHTHAYIHMCIHMHTYMYIYVHVLIISFINDASISPEDSGGASEDEPCHAAAAAVAAAPEAGSGKIFFKVMYEPTSNSKHRLMKLGAGAGQRLKKTDLVASLHRSAGHGTDVLMPSQASHVGSSGVEHVGVLSSITLGTASVEQGTHSWTDAGRVFRLRGVMTSEDVVSAITDMVCAGATDPESQYEVMCTPETVDRREALMWLANAGYVENVYGDEHRSAWRFKVEAVKMLEMMTKLQRPQKVFQVPPRHALMDASSYEIIKLLESEGWV